MGGEFCFWKWQSKKSICIVALRLSSFDVPNIRYSVFENRYSTNENTTIHHSRFTIHENMRALHLELFALPSLPRLHAI